MTDTGGGGAKINPEMMDRILMMSLDSAELKRVNGKFCLYLLSKIKIVMGVSSLHPPYWKVQ